MAALLSADALGALSTMTTTGATATVAATNTVANVLVSNSDSTPMGRHRLAALNSIACQSKRRSFVRL
jgi:hypothetical protein